MENSSIKYRSDIDGIRAIAVISVILYHFGILNIHGGFIGVDIFFVISGYLITKGIVQNVDKGSFSIGSFFVKRAKRLLPALVFIIAVTFISSCFILSPTDFASFCGSLIYGLTGLSNIYFWLQSGYFDSFSSLKPLLHTWSLSVEFQFYMVWPFLVIIACKAIKKESLRLLVAFLFVLLGLVSSVKYLETDATGAFFLTPFRMHEFAIGALVVFMSNVRINKIAGDILYVASILVLVLAAFLLNIDEIKFPGIYALIPCLATATLIFLGDKTRFSFLLSNKPMKHIGEISYSLYLTHWPVYVLYTYYIVVQPTGFDIFIMSATTIVMSYLSYYLVETRFRKPGIKGNENYFCMACAMSIIVLILPASSGWAENGWQWRIPQEIREVSNISDADTTKYTWSVHSRLNKKSDFDNNGKKKVLVIGDSQSADVVNMMKESGVIDKYDVVTRGIYVECAVNYISKEMESKFFNDINKRTVTKPELIPLCKESMSAAMDDRLLKKADIVLVAMNFNNQLLKYVKDGISEIPKRTNARVIVFGKKAMLKSSIDITTSFKRLTGIDRFAATLTDSRTAEANKYINSMHGIEFVDLMSYECPNDNTCYVLTEDKKPINYDGVHFTRYGAKFIGDKVFKKDFL
ncbi:acyltransferase family protein [Escherichia coli]|uniref:acyltransferase family protein n=1 Tax=Escherichia coli TaxID=562 RepID=UPI0022E0EA67|nr:acyltransferase family protein [Escherichia coli]